MNINLGSDLISKSIVQSRMKFVFIRGARHCKWLLEILNLHLSGLLGKRNARKCVLLGWLTKHSNGCYPVKRSEKAEDFKNSEEVNGITPTGITWHISLLYNTKWIYFIFIILKRSNVWCPGFLPVIVYILSDDWHIILLCQVPDEQMRGSIQNTEHSWPCLRPLHWQNRSATGTFRPLHQRIFSQDRV